MAAYEVARRLRIKRFLGVVSAGKEARVYRAVGRDGTEYAVKIYLTMTAEFRKSIYKYLLGDPRFQNVDTTSTKKLFFAWCRKEFRNLKRLYESGVPVPKPYLAYQNIVVMEFIGRDGRRAPLLHEAAPHLSEEELRSAWEQAIEAYRRALHCAGLVHADYSEFNLMWLDGKLYVIDVAQAVQLDHPNAPEFLAHDVATITRFFEKQGLEVPEATKLVVELAEPPRECRGRETWRPKKHELEEVLAKARELLEAGIVRV